MFSLVTKIFQSLVIDKIYNNSKIYRYRSDSNYFWIHYQTLDFNIVKVTVITAHDAWKYYSNCCKVLYSIVQSKRRNRFRNIMKNAFHRETGSEEKFKIT